MAVGRRWTSEGGAHMVKHPVAVLELIMRVVRFDVLCQIVELDVAAGVDHSALARRTRCDPPEAARSRNEVHMAIRDRMFSHDCRC